MDKITLQRVVSEHYVISRKSSPDEGGKRVPALIEDLPKGEYIRFESKQRACNDCGQFNVNRTVIYQLKNTRKETYWLKKCSICKEKTEIKHPLREE